MHADERNETKLINLPTRMSISLMEEGHFVPHFSGGGSAIFGGVTGNGCVCVAVFGDVAGDGCVAGVTTVCPTGIVPRGRFLFFF